jgi:hypothetical protein
VRGVRPVRDRARLVALDPADHVPPDRFTKVWQDRANLGDLVGRLPLAGLAEGAAAQVAQRNDVGGRKELGHGKHLDVTGVAIGRFGCGGHPLADRGP